MNYIPNETEHNHSKSNVVDAVVLFKVDPITRQISKVGNNDVVLVKNDHNSERYRISMPRYIDGHDMSLCDIARVHYINTGVSSGLTSSDVYESDDLSLIIEDGKTEETADEISFTWLVASTATQEYGRLAFAIELGCSSESAENGYSWHSGVYSNIEVSDGIHNSKLITSIYGDILQGWWEKISAAMGGAIEENSKEPFRFWIGTQAEYDELEATNQIIKDCVYFINDENIEGYIERTITEKAGEYVDSRLGDIGTGTVKDYVEDRLGEIGTGTVKDYVEDEIDEVKSTVSDHSSSKSNPHEVTAEQTGAVPKLPWSVTGADYRVYAQSNEDGSETHIWASDTNTSWGYIPRRSTGGNIIVPIEPIDNNHATAAAYVNSLVGGHNLLPKSAGEYTWDYTDVKHKIVTDIDLAPIFDRHGMGWYTLSADIRCETGVEGVNICANNLATKYSLGDNNENIVNVNSEWARYSITFKPVLKATSSQSRLMFIGTKGGVILFARNIKLELGTVASDWSPATGDLTEWKAGIEDGTIYAGRARTLAFSCVNYDTLSGKTAYYTMKTDKTYVISAEFYIGNEKHQRTFLIMPRSEDMITESTYSGNIYFTYNPSGSVLTLCSTNTAAVLELSKITIRNF